MDIAAGETTGVGLMLGSAPRDGAAGTVSLGCGATMN